MLLRGSKKVHILDYRIRNFFAISIYDIFHKYQNVALAEIYRFPKLKVHILMFLRLSKEIVSKNGPKSRIYPLRGAVITDVWSGDHRDRGSRDHRAQR